MNEYTFQDLTWKDIILVQSQWLENPLCSLPKFMISMSGEDC